MYKVYYIFDLIFYFSHCDSARVQELLTDENVFEKTETGHTLLHIACISGGKFLKKKIKKKNNQEKLRQFRGLI